METIREDYVGQYHILTESGYRWYETVVCDADGEIVYEKLVSTEAQAIEVHEKAVALFTLLSLANDQSD